MNTEKLDQNCSDIIYKNLKIEMNDKSKNKIIIYDQECELAIALKNSYFKAMPDAKVIDFNTVDPSELKKELYALNEGDYVILIQSYSFRISDYRIRLDINNRKIYCIEHARLAYLSEEQCDNYINSLTYDYDYYMSVSDLFESKLKNANTVKIVFENGSELIYDNGFEDYKKNIGDFSKTLGSFFPIGEIFTEPKLLDKVNGTAFVYAYPSLDHRINIVEPFEIEIKNGLIISHDGPEDFEQLLDLIRTENPDENINGIPFREMGFGMNRNISKEKPLADATSFERLSGFHISLGFKHNIYRKKIPKHIIQKFHIDIYLEAKEIWFDDTLIFKNREYLIN